MFNYERKQKNKTHFTEQTFLSVDQIWASQILLINEIQIIKKRVKQKPDKSNKTCGNVSKVNNLFNDMYIRKAK